MKKSIAAVSASVLGAAGATVAAAPAQAALPDCTSSNQHVIQAGATAADDWYMECIPQYGLGKADFSVTSDIDFPDEFDLNDPAVVASSALDSQAITDYFGYGTAAGGFLNLGGSYTSPRSHQYTGYAALPVTSVAKVDVTELPAECASTFEAAYRVDFAPSSTTFVQTIGGEEWKYVVEVAPQPLLLGVNFAAAGGAFDPTRALCAASGEDYVFASNSESGLWNTIASDHATIESDEFAPPTTLDPFVDGWGQLGTFARTPNAAPEPQLAATGANPLSAGLFATLLLAAGTGLAWATRRRKAAAR